MSQLNNRALTILHGEGIAGLINRIASRLLRKPQLINLYVLKLDYKDIAKLPPPSIDLEIGEITEMDDSGLEALAAFHFYGHSKGEILQYLAGGQRCYIAKHKDQVISCYWRITGDYYDYSLKRRFYLAETEEYLLGFFTLAEFRGKGIFPYVLEVSSYEQAQIVPIYGQSYSLGLIIKLLYEVFTSWVLMLSAELDSSKYLASDSIFIRTRCLSKDNPT
ncbi:MAG: hypothetical protein HS126_25015 [Anaerolineales bacterium]|nr:hypothetical protein [Anaerolineales bacterium]